MTDADDEVTKLDELKKKMNKRTDVTIMLS